MNTKDNEEVDKLVQAAIIGVGGVVIWIGKVSEEKLTELCAQADKLSDESLEGAK